MSCGECEGDEERCFDDPSWDAWAAPEIKKYYPSSWNGEHVQGAFLVDSFHWMTFTDDTGKVEHVEYMPELLDMLWRTHGLVFMAICSGGAALCNPH